MQLQTQYDWYNLLRAVLEPAVFLNWHSAYDEHAETPAHVHIRNGIPVTLDMLMGRGNYTDPVAQSMVGVYAYFHQVSNLAFKALKACVPRDPLAYFCDLVQ